MKVAIRNAFTCHPTHTSSMTIYESIKVKNSNLPQVRDPHTPICIFQTLHNVFTGIVQLKVIHVVNVGHLLANMLTFILFSYLTRLELFPFHTIEGHKGL